MCTDDFAILTILLVAIHTSIAAK